MFIWTPLFIVAYKLGWVDWSLWWLLLTLVFDANRKVRIKKG